ncbi:MAG: DUF4175 family protein [Planctomycetales bacterium]
MSISTSAAPVARAIPPEVAADELEQHLQEARQRTLALRGAALAMSVATGILVALGGMAAVDYWLELAAGWRLAWLVVVGLAGAAAAVVGWRQWIAQYSLARAAADAERRQGRFGQRLRTTLDYRSPESQPAPASPGLLAALHRETHQVSEQTDWNDVVDGRPTFKSFLGSAVVGCLWVLLLVASPEFRTASGRAVMIPWEYTRVDFTPHSQTVRIGESVQITVDISGRPTDDAQVRYRSVGSEGEWSLAELSPIEGKATETQGELLGSYSATLADLTEDMEFQVVAGPRWLPQGAIRVLQPLTLVASSVHVTPPSYTGRPEETVETLDVRVLEGSRVDLHLELNRPAAEVRLTRLAMAEEGEKETALDEGARSAATGESPLRIEECHVLGTLADLRHNVAFEFTATASDGMSLDPVRITVRVQLDRKPEVQLLEPPEELTVTPTTEVPIVVEARDDLSLHSVGILYQVSDGTPQVLWETDAGGTAEPLTGSALLSLEEHQVSFKDGITYYAFAEDDYFGQRRRTTTPLRFIDIRPYKLSFQLVEGGGSCNGSSVTLEELISRQRQVLNQTFSAQDQPADSALARRLRETQSELLDKTQEFTDGLTRIMGPMPSLNSALSAMEEAVESLDVPQLADALDSEQQALAALIRARENVRKKLSQSSSQACQACRKFDRDQRQKLRLPEKKKSDREQQLADTRKKLEELAQRERKWSQQARQSCPNPSSGGKSGQKSQASAASSSASSPQESSPSEKSPEKDNSTPQESNSESETERSPSERQEAQSPSPAEVAQAQRQMREELAELRRRLEQLDGAGQTARDPAERADQSMQEGLKELEQQQGEEAARQGVRSAEQLEQLADHLAAMNARDFGQRLDQAQKAARQLAQKEGALAAKLGESEQTAPGDSSRSAATPTQEPAERPGTAGHRLAEEQRDLAAQAQMLAEWLERLRRDAAQETGSVRRKLEAAHSENPPRDIAAGMQQAAKALQEDRSAQAARDVAQARTRLDELSQALGAVHADYNQPKLQELLALEEQLAQLARQLQRAREGASEGNAAAARSKWSELELKLEALAAQDRRLAEALQQLRQGGAKPKPGSRLTPVEHGAREGEEMPEGHYAWMELPDSNPLRPVLKVLQAQIQEALLAGGLMDADAPIPPAYRELVEKYYRALSDDLR